MDEGEEDVVVVDVEVRVESSGDGDVGGCMVGVVHGGFPSAHGNGGRGVQGGRGGRYQTTNTYPQNPQHQLLISTNVPTLDTYYTYINYG